ncbi:MAG: SwmB domain-containing protein, partial [Rhodospirillales bacterium]|nr:SwmB domain-containing protein [Rhodospirillales bacterium]
MLEHNGALTQGTSARGTGPQVSFVNPPENHDGESGFKLRVQFSGAPSGLSPKRDAASVLEVAGGTVTAATAETKNAGSPWSVTVEPAGTGDVTVRIPVRDCADPGAVCIGGQPLAEAAEAVVPGPQAVGCPAPALTGGAVLAWTGRVGIANWPGREFYGFGNGVRGTLDDRDFTLGSNDYLVDHVTQRGGSTGPLLFSLESGLSADEKRTLTLHVCEDGKQLRLSEASGPSRWQTYQWNRAGLDWSGHAERTLHLVQDATAPTLATATVTGAALKLAFSEALDETSAPAASAFAVTVGTDARAVEAVALAGDTVTLTLASAVTAGETATVSYTAPADTDPGLRDANGNRVAGFADAEVTNDTEAAALPAVSIASAATPVTEGTAASFTLERTGDTAAALEVSVSVSEAGSVLDGTPPSSATFATGSSSAQLTVATVNDNAHEADARVTATVVAGAGYTVAGDGASAGVDVFDDDTGAPGQQEAVETLWSTTMLWKDVGYGWYGGYADVFDEPEWTDDGTAFRIWFIDYHAPRRELRIAQDGSGGRIADPDELSLQIGGYTVEDQAVTAFAGVRTGVVSGIDSQWTAGEEIEIRLTRRTGETATTPALPGLSVSDAQVNEVSGNPLRFTVRLAEASGTAVSVRYATSDGTARAGEDYVGRSGAVRFAPGETEKTVEVEVLPDSHNEGSETMTLTLSRPFGTTLSDATATGTITNADPMPQAWIARFGRTVAEQAIEAVETRFAAPRQAGFAGMIAGQSVSSGADDVDGALEDRQAEDGLRGLKTLAARAGLTDSGSNVDSGSDANGGFADRLFNSQSASDLQPASGSLFADPRSSSGPESRGLTGRDLLTGSSFSLTRGTAETGFASVWGRGAVTRFDGRQPGPGNDGDLSLDGEVVSMMLGADFSRDRVLAGLMLSRSRGEGGYRSGENHASGSGRIETTLTALFPYARYALSERLSVWGMAGIGEGTLTLTPEEGTALRPDLSFLMGATGVRGTLLDGAEGGPVLTLKSDAMAVRTSTDAVSGDAGNLAAADGDVTRLRLALEGSRPITLNPGGDVGPVLTPSLEVGIRHDGGDAETGFGADIGAGIALADPARGISSEIRARGVLTHEDDGMRARGVSGSLYWDPAPATERGLSLDLTQTFGGPASGGAQTLFGQPVPVDRDATGDG